MELEEGSTFVSGVGDEVVLFLLFLVTSVIIVLLLSRRRRPQSKSLRLIGYLVDRFAVKLKTEVTKNEATLQSVIFHCSRALK